MPESSLDRVLRLAGGVTRAYVHQVRGRPVAVRQYATPHPAAARAATAPPPASAAPAAPKGTSSFGSLKRGQVVMIANQNYRVAQVNVPWSWPSGSAFTTGSGVQTTSGKNTGSQGTGLNTSPNSPAAAAAQQAAAALFGTPKQNPQLAALNGKSIPSGVATVTNLLTNLSSGWNWYVTLPAGFSIRVTG